MEFVARTPQQLGAVLKGYRTKTEATQSVFGSAVGLSQKEVSFIENHTDRMRIEQLFRFLSAAGLEIVIREKRARSESVW